MMPEAAHEHDIGFCLPGSATPRQSFYLRNTDPTNHNAHEPKNTTQDLDSSVPTPTSREWVKDAHCAQPDVDQDLFFSQGKETPDARRARTIKAKKICKECVVIEECLEYSLRLHKQNTGIPGIFAAKDEKERKQMINKMR